MPSVAVPVGALPRLVQIARSTHGDLRQQEWTVEGLWGMHLYRYGADLTVAGHRVRIEHGWAGFTPAGALAAYTFEGRSIHLFAHFEFPAGTPTRDLPLLFPVGPSFAALWAQLEDGMGAISTNFRHAEVKAWDVWLSILDIASMQAPPLSSPVRRALDIIERRLHDPLTVSEIAREVAISHNQLTRLFRAATGKTVIETIAERRVERARHLLERSTMPIKEVAIQVGLPDLQQFNKTMRRHLDMSPSKVRAQANLRGS